MEKPIIELKNIKHFAAMSQETYCYTATLYVDGKKFGTVGNEGHGGCDTVHPVSGGFQAAKELEERIKATYPREESEYIEGGLEPSLEGICCDLVSEFLEKKLFKSMMRRVCYIQNGEKAIRQMPSHFKPTPETIALIKAKAEWAKDVTFLADLSEEEAFSRFKEYC